VAGSSSAGGSSGAPATKRQKGDDGATATAVVTAAWAGLADADLNKPEQLLRAFFEYVTAYKWDETAMSIRLRQDVPRSGQSLTFVTRHEGYHTSLATFWLGPPYVI
jgi:hypothetical protein